MEGLLKAANTNNIYVIQRFVTLRDSVIPRVGLRTLYGFDDEEGVEVEIEASD